MARFRLFQRDDLRPATVDPLEIAAQATRDRDRAFQILAIQRAGLGRMATLLAERAESAACHADYAADGHVPGTVQDDMRTAAQSIREIGAEIEFHARNLADKTYGADGMLRDKPYPPLTYSTDASRDYLAINPGTGMVADNITVTYAPGGYIKGACPAADYRGDGCTCPPEEPTNLAPNPDFIEGTIGWTDRDDTQVALEALRTDLIERYEDLASDLHTESGLRSGADQRHVAALTALSRDYDARLNALHEEFAEAMREIGTTIADIEFGLATVTTQAQGTAVTVGRMRGVANERHDRLRKRLWHLEEKTANVASALDVRQVANRVGTLEEHDGDGLAAFVRLEQALRYETRERTKHLAAYGGQVGDLRTEFRRDIAEIRDTLAALAGAVGYTDAEEPATPEEAEAMADAMPGPEIGDVVRDYEGRWQQPGTLPGVITLHHVSSTGDETSIGALMGALIGRERAKARAATNGGSIGAENGTCAHCGHAWHYAACRDERANPCDCRSSATRKRLPVAVQ